MNKKASLKSSFHALLYLLPMLIFIGIFTVYPIFKSIAMSFYVDYNMITGEMDSVGLDNYKVILSDPKFFKAIKNTMLYVVGVVPASIIISMVIAIMLNSIPKLQGFFRSIYFLPFVTSTVAISVVWSWLYHSKYGLINYGLSFLGIDPINWLNSPKNAMLAVIIMAIWKGLGFNILLFLVGLGNIDDVYYQAAKVDGANTWSRFKNITLPLLRPTIFLLSIVGIINSFKVFDEVFALFSGRPGPAGSATTMVYYLFQKFYAQFKYGQAAASGIILFLIVLVLTLIQNMGNRYFAKRGGQD
ncbi:carbohydrate ABC transporter permease [Eremococcus coleocola]|uniref:ABC transporter, permease protein n=1 Tax=Eremococcus coleocola ACS-139-V-Col8 TaxID=908337 RepID=E4KRF2_9LACT|nr:sugar ABC transporter permease [Eremococcus coleocola]EFR30472.1 ABC transporter, permease protein [Eremococcus coleocola ACS-139-V-Col8]